MRTFYVVQMISGRYLAEYADWYGYTGELGEAARFDSEEEAIQSSPSSQPFTIIKFYDK